MPGFLFNSSFPRKRESRKNFVWIPDCAGMTLVYKKQETGQHDAGRSFTSFSTASYDVAVEFPAEELTADFQVVAD